MFKKYLTTILFISLTCLVLNAAMIGEARADLYDDIQRDQLGPLGSDTGLPGYDDPTGQTATEKVIDVVKMVLGTLVIIFLILTIYAGFVWMTAAGNEEKVSKAKNILKTSLIGVGVIVFSYVITAFVFNLLLKG